MGRRENIAKEGRKKAKTLKKLERKQKTKNELIRVILACEGVVTERNYFQKIFDTLISEHNISKTSLVIAKHAHTNPKGVLEDLLNALESDPEYEHKWIVIDRDEMRPNGGGHPLEDFNGAISSAEAKQIKVAYSNPSFEIWYLLHFEYRNTAVDRDEVIVQLEKYMEYSKNSQMIFDMLIKNQDSAIANAKRLIAAYEINKRQISPAIDNPSTTVHELIEVLNSLAMKYD
jgi:hypothetical protein